VKSYWSGETEYAFDVVTPGAAVLTTAQLKTACRIELTDDNPSDPDVVARNAELVSHEAAARDYCERLTGRLFSPTTVKLVAPFPSKDGRIYLRRFPVTSITSFKCRGTDGNYVTQVAGTDYFANLVGTDPFLSPTGTNLFFNYSLNWPVRQDAIEVIFVAGYATGTLPAMLLDCVRALVVWRFENPSNIDKVPEGINRRLASMRIAPRGGTW
jgi:uncharacterized phiE125 gp8 family phage protein